MDTETPLEKTESLNLTITNTFTFKDRLKVLFGMSIQNVIACAVTAKLEKDDEGKHRIEMKFDPGKLQTLIGRPIKKAA